MRFFFATLFLLFSIQTAHAQSFGEINLTNADPFSVSVSPQYVTPYSKVSLSFLSTSLDLTNATLTVSDKGKTIYQGDVQPVSVTAGKGGSVTTLKAVILANGVKYSQTVVIQPQDVSLIVEPISSTHILYAGKPLVPLEGDSRIIAIANFKDAAGKTLDPNTLSYQWTVEDTLIANSSGIGKTSIVVASPLQYRERVVSVVVQSPNGTLVGGASLSLVPQEPSVRIYENDPLLGIRFEHALAGPYSISGTEDNLYAVPFSLPFSKGNSLIQWFLNGTYAQTGSAITLRQTGTGEGTGLLSLTTSIPGLNTQATTDLPLSFGKKSSFNFFGL